MARGLDAGQHRLLAMAELRRPPLRRRVPVFAARRRQIEHLRQLGDDLAVVLDCLPVLTPPWSVSPFCSRALTLMSKPFQCSICLPYLSDSVFRFCDLPELRRLDVVEPGRASPPLVEQARVGRHRHAEA